MKTGQFVKGIFNGSTEAYQTQGAEKLLSIEEFDVLWNRDKPGVWLYINQEEAVIAKTTITVTSDGEHTGRKGVINHTVIVKFDSATTKDGAIYTLNRRSIDNDLAAKIPALNSPFPELKQPLDPIKESL